jgi:hypothetical protein
LDRGHTDDESWCLRLQIFSFIVGIKAETIKKGEPIASGGDGDRGAKRNVASCLATHDGSAKEALNNRNFAAAAS